jgi:hypothetical protein
MPEELRKAGQKTVAVINVEKILKDANTAVGIRSSVGDKNLA